MLRRVVVGARATSAVLSRHGGGGHVAATTTTATTTATSALTCSRAAYSWFVFKNPSRRPQLTPEERAQVTINYDEWPAEFRDYDPEDPYKNSPEVIEGMTSWNLFLWGLEFGLIYQLYELVFYKSI